MPRDEDISTDASIEKCPYPYQEYFHYGQACYRIYEDEKAWQEAEDSCLAEHGHLISVADEQERAFLHLLATSTNANYVWIGLSSTKDPRQYAWSDGTPAQLTAWTAGQPPASNDSRCAALDTGDPRGRWQARDCGLGGAFVCKATDGGPVPPAAPPADGACPAQTATNWTEFGGGYCYAFQLDNRVNWDDARLSCRQDGAELLHIQSVEQQQQVEAALAEYPEAVWSGLARPDASESFAWSGGAPVTYVGWAAGQPSDDAFHCARLTAGDRRWDDVDCRLEKLAYVCQLPKSGGTQDPHTYPPLETEFPTTVPPTEQPPSSLSTAAIVGIAVAALVALVAVAYLGHTYKDPIVAAATSFRHGRHDLITEVGPTVSKA